MRISLVTSRANKRLMVSHLLDAEVHGHRSGDVAPSGDVSSVFWPISLGLRSNECHRNCLDLESIWKCQSWFSFNGVGQCNLRVGSFNASMCTMKRYPNQTCPKSVWVNNDPKMGQCSYRMPYVTRDFWRNGASDPYVTVKLGLCVKHTAPCLKGGMLEWTDNICGSFRPGDGHTPCFSSETHQAFWCFSIPGCCLDGCQLLKKINNFWLRLEVYD